MANPAEPAGFLSLQVFQLSGRSVAKAFREGLDQLHDAVARRGVSEPTASLSIARGCALLLELIDHDEPLIMDEVHAALAQTPADIATSMGVAVVAGMVKLCVESSLAGSFVAGSFVLQFKAAYVDIRRQKRKYNAIAAANIIDGAVPQEEYFSEVEDQTEDF